MEPSVGPPSYENWRAAVKGDAAFGAVEYQIFTDASVQGMITEGYGPYQFLNAFAFHQDFHVARPAIVLRVQQHLTYAPLDHSKTIEDGYHGGWLQDEVAAIVSLCMGIRARAGDRCREFGPGQAQGYPYVPKQVPVLAFARGPAILPDAAKGEHSLNERLVPFLTFTHLSRVDATALVRAARLYQSAMWMAEVDPNQSWILFSSAIETAAVRWHRGDDTPVDQLKSWKPQLYDLLIGAGGEAHAAQVAEFTVDVTAATKKFMDFLMKFHPGPPDSRPPEFSQLKWSKRSLRGAFDRVYEYRSRALHEGTPFPLPMCQATRYGSSAPPEAFVGLSGTGVYNWGKEALPLTLHAYEHIVRGSLLNWWQAMADAATTAADAQAPAADA